MTQGLERLCIAVKLSPIKAKSWLHCLGFCDLAPIWILIIDSLFYLLCVIGSVIPLPPHLTFLEMQDVWWVVSKQLGGGKHQKQGLLSRDPGSLRANYLSTNKPTTLAFSCIQSCQCASAHMGRRTSDWQEPPSCSLVPVGARRL